MQKLEINGKKQRVESGSGKPLQKALQSDAQG